MLGPALTALPASNSSPRPNFFLKPSLVRAPPQFFLKPSLVISTDKHAAAVPGCVVGDRAGVAGACAAAGAGMADADGRGTVRGGACWGAGLGALEAAARRSAAAAHRGHAGGARSGHDVAA